MLETPTRKIDCIVGARPNFVKIAPIVRALRKQVGVIPRIIHTGQHYDVGMNAIFFSELGIPDPDLNLDVGSGTSTQQTAHIMLKLEPVLLAQRPDLVLVVGDVNSTMAAALVAAKLNIPIAHVEAGLRSFDRTMPEEINRVVTDSLAQLFYVTELSGVDNLARGGIDPDAVKLVGNVMIDTMHACLDRAVPAEVTLAESEARRHLIDAAISSGFAFVTLHRPSNVDDPPQLKSLIAALVTISEKICLVWPIHPRTKAMIAGASLEAQLRAGRIIAMPPLSYLRALGLMREARFAITDSGGVQEETTALGIPCLTVRDNTERPVTIEEGTNSLVGTSAASLVAAANRVLTTGGSAGRIPELWDGKAALRIVRDICAFLGQPADRAAAFQSLPE